MSVAKLLELQINDCTNVKLNENKCHSQHSKSSRTDICWQQWKTLTYGSTLSLVYLTYSRDLTSSLFIK